MGMTNCRADFNGASKITLTCRHGENTLHQPRLLLPIGKSTFLLSTAGSLIRSLCLHLASPYSAANHLICCQKTHFSFSFWIRSKWSQFTYFVVKYKYNSCSYIH